MVNEYELERERRIAANKAKLAVRRGLGWPLAGVCRQQRGWAGLSHMAATLGSRAACRRTRCIFSNALLRSKAVWPWANASSAKNGRQKRAPPQAAKPVVAPPPPPLPAPGPPPPGAGRHRVARGGDRVGARPQAPPQALQ